MLLIVLISIAAVCCCAAGAAPRNEDQLVPHTFAGLNTNVSQGPGATEARLRACADSRARWLASDKSDMSACLRDLLAASFEKLRTADGLPALGVPSMEPLYVTKATISDSSVFTGTISNLYVHGFSEAFLKPNVNVQPSKKNGLMQIKMRAPKGLRILGDFEAKAYLLRSVIPFYDGPPSEVSGLFDAEIDSPTLTINAAYTNDPDHGAVVDGVQLSFNFDNARVKLRNEKLLTNTLLTLLNGMLEDSDLSRKVINEATPDILRGFQDPMFRLLDSGFDETKDIVGR
ncbi:unnamed protein product [Notodromas monacha]|uniref:Uncharacterized protein n=1 Tax=Notodromas monacha TaxID=399045 RepID=A0A7R9BYX3_9CRUS|nr:unnamed protein product [Notodromas monacha]CAG0924229.1 unnamed protein product [Notodromas monacha]